MTTTATPTATESVLQEAVRQGVITAETTAVGFIDVDGVRRTVADLHRSFGDAPSVLHAFAAKANPIVPVLRLLRDCGMGCEVASPGELAVALAAGFAPDQVVLDSPAKTQGELRQALGLGVAVNVDNVQELHRVARLVDGRLSTSVCGLRVNPQIGTGSIGAMSTATETSKFGVALRDVQGRQLILDAFTTYPWLTRLHAHVGSQGCPLEMIAEGIAAIFGLAEEINAALGRRQVTSLDIGGGLPVNFSDERITPTFDAYVEQLEARIPSIFDGAYSLVTEFGRSILAKNGFLAATVEYTKTAGGAAIALTHAGGHLATRTVFMPEAWPLRITAYSGHGERKDRGSSPVDIGGPLCFAGDLVAKGRALPELAPGDIIVLHDTGAYYFSSPWSYNSIPSPAVYAYAVDDTGEVTFTLAREPQSIDDVVRASGGDLGGALSGIGA